jgi:hypothetical protein
VTDPKQTPTTEETAWNAGFPAEARRTIDELHNALWLALKVSDGEIVVTPEELAEWGKPAGRIEWLTDPSNGIKIIRLVEVSGT